MAALGLFTSILLHELGHVFVARRFGIPVRGIRLFVFGGVAELGGEPKKPGHEILLALGGPVVTILLIGLFNLGLSLIVAGSGIGWNATDGFLHLQGGSMLAAGSPLAGSGRRGRIIFSGMARVSFPSVCPFSSIGRATDS